jgi:glycopeptide antibiotics resistance protein
MWAYREMLAGYKYWKEDVIQNIQNIVFFIPFGILHPARKGKGVLITALLLSALIEATQYIGGFGLAEIDDVICNTLGALLGLGLVSFVKRKKQNAT